MTTVTREDLPGLDCGLCGFRNCDAMAERLKQDPDMLQRCLPKATGYLRAPSGPQGTLASPAEPTTHAGAPGALAAQAVSPPATSGCAVASSVTFLPGGPPRERAAWCDTLGREFDFFLEHFPEDPGPREIILPHNPLLTRELDIEVGDVLIGRPLGMSCGCPITHSGVAMQVDQRTGVMAWCVTGPLRPRQEGYKDLGYYIAEGYEGLIVQSRCDIAIGRRYFFQPRMCMLQWRHSGLVNFLNRTTAGLAVRLEGLWIG